MGGLIGGILSLFGGLVKGFFSTKESQLATVNKTLDLVNQVTENDGSRDQAVAAIISAEASSGSWLAVNWRPLFMVLFMAIVATRWFFGYTPPFMSKEEVMRLYDLIELGIGGYIGGRTLEKIASSIQLGSVLKAVLTKNKLL